MVTAKGIVLESDYSQAIGTTQQHDLDVSRFLATGELILSASAAHVPRDNSGSVAGTSGTVVIGAIVNGIIPVMLSIPLDNVSGVHWLTVTFVTTLPSEIVKFRIRIPVPF